MDGPPCPLSPLDVKSYVYPGQSDKHSSLNPLATLKSIVGTFPFTLKIPTTVFVSFYLTKVPTNI